MADVFADLEKLGRDQDALDTRPPRSPLDAASALRLGEHCANIGRSLLGELEERLQKKKNLDSNVGKRWERGYDLDITQRNKFLTPDKGDVPLARDDAVRMTRESSGLLKVANLGILRVTSIGQFEKFNFTSETAIDPSAGVLIATQNFSVHDVSGYNRLFNSDLLFMQWKHAAKSDKVNGLKQIWRYSITNPITVAIIEDCLRAKRGRKKEAATFSKRHDAFAMLCRTPNGKGLVRMLTDHAHELGYKGIKQVTVLWSEFCFT